MMLSVRGLGLVLAVFAAVGAQAQLGRWQLGNPSLILDLPGDPGGGGVSWHNNALSILPTSWSSESGDLRVEVAETYGSLTPAALAQKLGGTPSSNQSFNISGYPGNRFSVGAKVCLVAEAPGRTWAVVATPKTSAGVALAEKVLTSIVVERSGEKRWVQRSLGNTRMNAALPFELAYETFDTTPTRRSYELHFDDFGVKASVSSPGEGMVLEFDKTIKSTIESEKDTPGTKDFKVKREKLKRDQLDGELVTMEFTRNKPYKRVVFFGKDGGNLLRLTLDAKSDKPAHEGYVNQIVDSLRVSSVNFAGFAPRQAGSEGVWFDMPKEFEKLDASNYNCFAGSFQINVRVTPVSGGTSNPDQLLDFLEAKFKMAKDARDFKAERSSKQLNGVETRILKSGYKGKGRADQTMQYGMAIFLPDRIIVAEMISEEQQKGYLERILDTARIEIAPPDGWSRIMAGDSGLSMLAPKVTFARPAGDSEIESEVNFNVQGDGIMAMVIEFKYKGEPKAASAAAMQIFKSLQTTLGSTGQITSQQPIEIGNHSGLRLGVDFTRAEGKALGDIIVLRQGKYLWTYMSVTNPEKPAALKMRATILNSLQ